ncbi:hypothetical protein [Mesorhizobium sp. M1163]|uniref:hypothetical protein n=1 Tax=Mesorhizobium sp. M1163 TaxID=2957065 RepID=UPI003334E4AF
MRATARRKFTDNVREFPCVNLLIDAKGASGIHRRVSNGKFECRGEAGAQRRNEFREMEKLVSAGEILVEISRHPCAVTVWSPVVPARYDEQLNQLQTGLPKELGLATANPQRRCGT